MRNARITGWGAAAIAAVLVATAASPAGASVLEDAATETPAPIETAAPEASESPEPAPSAEPVPSAEPIEVAVEDVTAAPASLAEAAERTVNAAIAAAAVGDLTVTVFEDRYQDGVFDASKVGRTGQSDAIRQYLGAPTLIASDGSTWTATPLGDTWFFDDVPAGGARLQVQYPTVPVNAMLFDATDPANLQKLTQVGSSWDPRAEASVTVGDGTNTARTIGISGMRVVADVKLPDGSPATGATVELGANGEWLPATEYDFQPGSYEHLDGGYVYLLPGEFGVRVTAPAGYRVGEVTAVSSGGNIDPIPVTSRDGAYWLQTTDASTYTSNPTFTVTLEELPTADLVVTEFHDYYADGVYDPSKTGRDGRSDAKRDLGPRIRQSDGTWLEATRNADGDFVFADLPIGEKKVEFLDPNSYVSAAFFDATDAASADDIERLPLGGSTGSPTGVATVDLDEDGAKLVVGMTALRAVAAVEYADGSPVRGATVELGSAGEWFPATEYDFAGGQGTYEAFDSNGYVRHLPDELGVRVTAPAGYRIGAVTAADGGAIDVVERGGAYWIDTVDASSYFSNPTFTVTLAEVPTADVRITSFDDRYADGVFDTSKVAKDGRSDETNARISRLVTAQGAIISPTTEANGDQVFEDVPVGEAKVYFVHPNSAFDSIFFDATDAESADDIERLPNESGSAYAQAVATVAVDEQGSALEVGFTALRATAEVEYADGAPASDVEVELGSDRRWYPATEYDFTGGEGTYEAFADSYYVRHLPDEIGVRVTPPAGYAVAEVTARETNSEGAGEIDVRDEGGTVFWLDTADAASYFSAPTFVVTLEEIPTASVDVAYFLDVALDGVYESGTDTAVPGAEVYLQDAAGDWWATTSLDGTYAFSGIAPGEATVYVEIPETVEAPEAAGLPGLELPEAALAVWDATDLASYRDVVEAETTTVSFEGSLIAADGTTTPIVVEDAGVGAIPIEVAADTEDSDVAQVFVGAAAVLQTAAVVDATSLGSVPGAQVEFLANGATAAGSELAPGSGAFIAAEDDGEVAVFGAAEYGIRPTVPAGFRVVDVAAVSLTGTVLEVTAQQAAPATGRAALFAAASEYRVAPEEVGGPVGGIVWAVAVAPITVAPPVVPGVDLPPTVGLPAGSPAVLPATGSDVNLWALVFGASLLLAAGLGTRMVARRRAA
ncbi:LPXTG cell wall anchor domain-containing protein [Microbacterium sp. A1-JK]|uniref:LPXTG cell wall anchor domain-containing protein n=1 Tax=Microbacterium sp. A1-JK TaxID=3177516 RepID=UPI003884AB79